MPVALIRPNGKTYRPRMEPRAEQYMDREENTCVVVLGTHDLDAATALAQPMWDSEGCGCPLPAGDRSWWRLVPYDTGTGYERNWIKDDARGTACVVFEHE